MFDRVWSVIVIVTLLSNKRASLHPAASDFIPVSLFSLCDTEIVQNSTQLFSSPLFSSPTCGQFPPCDLHTCVYAFNFLKEAQSFTPFFLFLFFFFPSCDSYRGRSKGRRDDVCERVCLTIDSHVISWWIFIRSGLCDIGYISPSMVSSSLSTPLFSHLSGVCFWHTVNSVFSKILQHCNKYKIYKHCPHTQDAEGGVTSPQSQLNHL